MKDLHFTFSREIETEENLLRVIPTVPKLQLRFRESERGVPSLKVWFWNVGGVVKYRYLHSGYMGRKALKKKLLALGAREFPNGDE